MPALMRPNPFRANLQAGGNVYGTMAFEFFSMCIALERIALKEGVALTPGSHRTPCWRKTDSSAQPPAKKDPPRRDVRPFQHFPSERDRGFESVFLQRGVSCEPDFLDAL